MTKNNHNKNDNIFLIGPMGAGKTTIGLQLAKALACDFYDSDRVIEEKTGAGISLIFDLEGEEGFRGRESAAIDELTQRSNIVLATGGGAVLREENRQHLMQRGMVVYLEANVDQLFYRTSKDRNRPLLQTDNPQKKIAEILHQRAPLYRSVADIIVSTNKQSVKSVVDIILETKKRL